MTVSQVVDFLNSNIASIGAACIGAGATLAWVKGYVNKAWAALTSTQGKLLIADAKAASDLAAKTMADAGHPEPDAVKKALDGFFDQLPKALVLACLLGLGAGLSAEPIGGWCAGPAVWAGSALFQADGGNILQHENSTLGGLEFAGYLGSWEGKDFTPTYTLGLVGGLRTKGVSNTPMVGLTGGVYLIGAPVTIFVAKDLGADAGGLLWGIGTNVQFSGYVPFLYLGHPGN